MPALASRLAGRELLLDSNLLLLLLFGLVRPESVGGKRLERYSMRQFQTLCEIVSSGRKIVVTPHVLAETSNLIRAALYGEPQHNALALLTLEELSWEDASGRQSRVVLERHAPRELLNPEWVRNLGVTDAGLLFAAAESEPVLVTDDLDLYLGALRLDREAENFSHVWDD